MKSLSRNIVIGTLLSTLLCSAPSLAAGKKSSSIDAKRILIKNVSFYEFAPSAILVGIETPGFIE